MLQIESEGILEILLRVQLNHFFVVLIAVLISHRRLRLRFAVDDRLFFLFLFNLAFIFFFLSNLLLS